MSRRVVLRPDAEEEIQEAASWYQDRGGGLASEFLRALDACLASVARRPLQYPLVHGEKRRALLRRFPYAVVFAADDDEVVILGCLHCRRDPRRWADRR
jgi:plasmid stabilization system protein ParE